MSEPTIKHLWAGMAMMAMLLDKRYEGTFADIAEDAWRMADELKQEEEDRDE